MPHNTQGKKFVDHQRLSFYVDTRYMEDLRTLSSGTNRTLSSIVNEFFVTYWQDFLKKFATPDGPPGKGSPETPS